MSFSARGLYENLQNSFSQGGFDDLVQFLLRHKETRRWIIASDFNLGSSGAAHNVFAFAAYPTGKRNYFEHIERLTKAIPRDFKHTRLVTREIKKFFQGDDCFCFVILAPPSRMFFKAHADHASNLRDAKELLEGLRRQVASWSNQHIKSDIKRLCEKSKQRSFSLTLLENMLIFAVSNAFVSYNVAFPLGASLVGWFPDRDNMTTFADSAWVGLAHANFHGLWGMKSGRQSPNVSLVDHRVRGTNDLYDPLIRVPDFLAATISRWRLDENMLMIPDGTGKEGRRRYRQVIKAWAADNPNLWIGRIFRDDEGVCPLREDRRDPFKEAK